MYKNLPSNNSAATTYPAEVYTGDFRSKKNTFHPPTLLKLQEVGGTPTRSRFGGGGSATPSILFP